MTNSGNATHLTTHLTVSEVAKRKGVTRAAVYTAIVQRRLAHERIMGRIAVKKADAEAWKPLRSPGRPPGRAMSADTKLRISAAQKQKLRKSA
jgi:hypothetical protein